MKDPPIMMYNPENPVQKDKITKIQKNINNPIKKLQL
ncbi:hypothetical protein C8J95_10847 [Elizabethkingia sp. YR214]|nr:hypothetical protein C8J95_10847 [Elizabethkingia sp. YR214]